MADYAPHTDADLASMLEVLGHEHLDDLFRHIPERLGPAGPLDLPPGRSEDEVVGTLSRLAARNRTDVVCFAGGGAYDHYVPAVVDAVLQRGELLTSYTPYQPEVSQGILQIIFEFQTMICELTGLPLANASLYDGASAVAEAAAMACAATRRSRLLVSGGVDDPTRQVLATYAHPHRRPISGMAVDPAVGTTAAADAVGDDVAAMVVAQPNAFGVVEDIRAHAEAAHAAGALLIVKLEPTAVGLLATPGQQGADIVVGDGQPLGQGLQFGGPTVGFLACADAYARRLPGRVVGQTVDTAGRRGYVMTMRTREQDIRRERATSNICTNQTLSAVAATVYMSWLGPAGLQELALGCLRRAHATAEHLEALDGVDVAFSGPYLKEFAMRLPSADVHAVVGGVCDEGYLIGPVVDDPAGDGQLVMVATTERRTTADITGLTSALERQLKEQRG